MAPSPALHDTFGVLVICTIGSSFLLAVQHYQANLYLKRFWRRDPRYFRYNVIAVTAIDTLHQIFCLYTLYLYLVHLSPSSSSASSVQAAKLRRIQRCLWPVTATVFTGTLVSYLVQM
ncbi:uncharacterized protein EI90DRAFT_1350238 [Cantharellus anzutake]|uniref:uncharacterized protein n=1 Tax=Cantharellus anzutake TaxID=1750568 RepID=UPI001905ABDF|nr:uncharacterized protein EI90DRAFT_1350238 [Cantharellus anzutake]KAF8329827.1 hypothetical protein EI90DRAFT_1350238 [Cantharellus anzutake]